MKEIFLLRHGKTEIPGRYIGSTNVSLSDEGREDISRFKKNLESIEFDEILCSPLKRCLQTSEILGMENVIKIDERIREIDFGRWEGKSFKEICVLDADLVEQWNQQGTSFIFPEGEGMPDFIQRIHDFAKEISLLSGQKILIIAHGGVIRHLICRFLNLPSEHYLYFKIDPGKITTIELYSHGGVMTALNHGVNNG